MTPLRTLTITFALMLAVACGSDAVPASSPPATVTPFVAATKESFSGASATSIELLGLGAKRNFPVELFLSSVPLPPMRLNVSGANILEIAESSLEKGIRLLTFAQSCRPTMTMGLALMDRCSLRDVSCERVN